MDIFQLLSQHWREVLLVAMVIGGPAAVEAWHAIHETTGGI